MLADRGFPYGLFSKRTPIGVGFYIGAGRFVQEDSSFSSINQWAYQCDLGF